jgi:glycerate 2-kinase
MKPASIRHDAARTWQAAIDSVRPDVLVPHRLCVAAGRLLADGTAVDPPAAIDGRIVVVGGGKAAAGMAAAVERLLSSALAAGARLDGLVSVPEGCGRQLEHVEVRETRPRAANVPTPAAVAATREMKAMLAGLTPADLAIALVSGGGSALLVEPRPGVPLAEKIALTRFLSAAGADIRDLNTVRQAASGVKAGGLARACNAGRLVALVLSDIIGDPLDLIASGPCTAAVPDPRAALAVLRRFAGLSVSPAITRLLEEDARTLVGARPKDAADCGSWTTPSGCRVSHVLLGSNATAVEAAAAAARGLGYDVTVRHATAAPVEAEVVGGRLAGEAADLLARAHRSGRPAALVEGGEATVRVPRDHGLGGRNQQTVLAALDVWQRSGREWPDRLALASIGTDGEDGPTDAAGAIIDADVAATVRASAIDVSRAVARCDAHSVLGAVGGLVRTGPTGTNVADVRLILARP